MMVVGRSGRALQDPVVQWEQGTPEMLKVKEFNGAARMTFPLKPYHAGFWYPAHWSSPRFDATRAARNSGHQRPAFLCPSSANSLGVSMPVALRGRIALQSLRHDIKVSSASSSHSKTCAFRHPASSRSLDESRCARPARFKDGMNSHCRRRRSAQASSARETSSVPSPNGRAATACEGRAVHHNEIRLYRLLPRIPT